jgi:hypothetical protein
VLDELEELEQADGATGTPTDVEGASRKLIDAAPAAQEGVDEIVDEQEVSDLLSVAVEGELLAGEGPDEKVGHPALILGAKLVWPVDAARAEDSRRETEGAGVVENVLIRAALGAAVGAAKLEGAVFADTEGLNRRIAGTPRSP